MKLSEMVKPKDLAKAWSVSRDMILDIARREGIPVLKLGYCTRRILAKDIDRLQDALLRRAKRETSS